MLKMILYRFDIFFSPLNVVKWYKKLLYSQHYDDAQSISLVSIKFPSEQM